MWDLVDIYLGSLFTILSSILFSKIVLKKRFQVRKIYVFLCVFIVTFILLLLYLFYDISIFRTFMSFVLFGIVYKYIYKLNVYESLLSSIIFIIALTISEIFVFVFLNNILKVNHDFLYNVFAVSYLSNFVISFIAILLCFINKKWLLKLISIKIKNFVVTYIILLFCCIIFFFYVTFSNIGNGISLVSGVTVIIILLFVVINLLIQAYRNNELTIKYDKLLEFIKKYEVEIDNQRTMRHEIKNQLLTIKSKIIDKDKNRNIISYIDEILEDNSKVINHVEYAKLNYLPPNGIKGLFYFKVSEALDKDIKVSINISKDIENSLLKDLNSNMFNQVGKLFGILLDNAIEAAEIAHEKKIGIEIYVVNNKVNFIVSNTYIGDVGTSKGVFSRSTKGENRGHGLLLAKAIVNSNNRFEMETTITDVLYIQKLIIK